MHSTITIPLQIHPRGAIGILLDFDEVMIIRRDYQLRRNLVKATTVRAIVVTGQAEIRSYKRWSQIQVEC